MGYEYTTVGQNDVMGGFFAALAGMSVFILIACIFEVVVMWKIFTKAGKQGWISLIPFYNVYTLFEITWGKGIYFLLLLTAIVPVLGTIAVIVIMIITMVKLGKVFGKSDGFIVGLVLLPVIFEAIVAFDNSQYLGIQNTSSQPTNNTQPTTSASVPNQFAQPQQTTYCPNCGTALTDENAFCPNCGTPRN